MKRKILAVCTTAMLALGLVAVGATSASAHTGDLKVTAACNTATGQYDFVAKLNLTQTNLVGATKFKVGTSNFEGTPTKDTALSGGPIESKGTQTIELTRFSLPGTTKGFGPWVYAFTSWSDKFSKGSDGQLLTALAGDCKIPVQDVKDATASVATTPATCAVPGTATFAVVNATWDDATDLTDGSRTATATSGHLFSDGTAKATVTYTIEPKLDATKPPCYVAPPVVKVPLIQDYVKCDGAAFVLDNTGSNADVVYTVNGVKYTVPAKAAVHTDANGTLIKPNKDGKYIITAEGRDEAWTFDAKDCTVPPVVPPTDTTTPPTTTPSPSVPVVTPPATTTTPVVVAPTKAASVTTKAAAPAATNEGSLAYTGSDATPYVAGAIFLALLGTALILLKRRRKSTN
jgi:LPXTG-motif cell wall-anchored protein